MLNKSIGEEEAEYTKLFVKLKEHIWLLKRVYDTPSSSLSLFELCLFHFELSNFEDEILLKRGGRNITLDFSNPEWWTQDDSVMKNLVLLYWFYQFNFQTKLFISRCLLYTSDAADE